MDSEGAGLGGFRGVFTVSPSPHSPGVFFFLCSPRVLTTSLVSYNFGLVYVSRGTGGGFVISIHYKKKLSDRVNL